MLFAGQNIDGSPFGVTVGMALGDASKVTARGPGLEPVGNVANKATYFDIYTAGGGMGGAEGLWGHVLVVVWPWHGQVTGDTPSRWHDHGMTQRFEDTSLWWRGCDVTCWH